MDGIGKSQLAADYARSMLSVRLWDVATGKTHTTLSDRTGFVYASAFSPDGRTLAAGSSDATARLWRYRSWSCARRWAGCGATASYLKPASYLFAGGPYQPHRRPDATSGRTRPWLATAQQFRLGAHIVLQPLLSRGNLTEDEARTAASLALSWLEASATKDPATTPEAHFILRALLERPGLTEHEVSRAASFADQWLVHNSATEQAGS
ncbi:WD40 repeat domain-containing protein [Streptomyces chartreusis]|uniref:WD40 repeat domain-containing protein n=1 Tax=Streptomyces chartreusis TaxID=1969 RepID=UPI003806E361